MGNRWGLGNETALAARLQQWTAPEQLPGIVGPGRHEPHVEGHEESEPMPVRPRIVHLLQVMPFLQPVPHLLYDFTIPELMDRTASLLRGERNRLEGPYRGYRFSGVGGPERRDPVQYVRALEAAHLVSGIYSRCLDPVRFDSSGAGTITKADVFETFARRLRVPRIAAAVDSIAAGLDDLRALDRYQPRIGSTAAHWLQYLARELLDTPTMSAQPYPNARQERVRDALRTIRDSVTAVDRFTALARGVL